MSAQPDIHEAKRLAGDILANLTVAIYTPDRNRRDAFISYAISELGRLAEALDPKGAA